MSHAAALSSDALRPHLACVRLEYRGGKAFAIASDSFVMAIYYIGPTTEPDEFMNVACGGELLAIAGASDALTFEGWQIASIATLSLYESKSSGVWPLLPDKEPLFTNWWRLIPDPAKFERGFIYLQDELFRKLAATSPSGHIVFPAVVDNTDYMYLRDVYDPNWLGLIHARKKDGCEPATIPEWLK